ncbi:COP23 domain-containing protein [Leptothoe kymatousa TAU-MAC 1615]|uniref:COP23 domain-containing protein n=2 Tax=Leptothoe TaxID=2651725 RepID=A0ABS5XZH9_9CYAN|nr:COP23 domain-containing protein [Leptothoe kymatousa TAU-MAC 1615]
MGWITSLQSCGQILTSLKGCTVAKASVLVMMGSVSGPMVEVALANNGEADAAPLSSRFTCELQNGSYTVMYRPKSEPGQAYPWAVPTAMGGGWTPQRRCETISARLEEYRPDGLVELRTDVENGYNTVCATTEDNLESCRIVFTVPPGQDPTATRDAVFSNITLADSGTSTSGVNTFVGGTQLPETELFDSEVWNSSIAETLGNVLSGQTPQRQRASGIYLKPYLDPADGGTGEYLTPSKQLLSPDNFR